MVDATGIVEIADFTITDVNIRFRVDDDVFEAVPDIPLPLLTQMAGVSQLDQKSLASDSGTTLMDKMMVVFDGILTEASARRFRERVEDRQRPIGIKTVLKIFPWLLEQYGLRPTTPSAESSDSSDGQATSTSSTAGAPSEASTTSVSPDGAPST